MEWTNGEFIVSTDQARLDHQAVFSFLGDAYWAKWRSSETILRSFEHSLVFGLYRGHKQVGLARVVSDFATFAWLCDVYIHSDYRRQGLGKWLLTCIQSHPDLHGLRRWFLATQSAHSLYAQFGFTPLAHPERFMERMNEIAR